MSLRTINTDQIEQVVRDSVIEINTSVNNDLKKRLTIAKETEISPIGKNVLDNILMNFDIAEKNNLPICQDTGMAIIFVELGQDVHIKGKYLEDAINQGVREGYKKGYLRKSIVKDPITRINTNDNSPAIIHTKIVPGNQIKLTIIAKGFGSENTSDLKMLKPSDGLNGIEEFIFNTIEKAIPNACAPIIVGVGIGGDFESSALNAKKALTLPLDYKNPSKLYQELTERLLIKSNNTGIGPMGLGGINSVLAINIIPSPTHIAGLPVAVNICCYVDRVIEKVI